MKKIKVDLGFSDSVGVYFELISAKEFSDRKSIDYISDEFLLQYAATMGFEVIDDNSDKIRYQYYAGQWFDCDKEHYDRLNKLEFPLEQFEIRIINSYHNQNT